MFPYFKDKLTLKDAARLPFPLWIIISKIIGRYKNASKQRTSIKYSWNYFLCGKAQLKMKITVDGSLSSHFLVIMLESWRLQIEDEWWKAESLLYKAVLRSDRSGSSAFLSDAAGSTVGRSSACLSSYWAWKAGDLPLLWSQIYPQRFQGICSLTYE